MKIRHDVFMVTVILTLGISSIAANQTQSQTKDTVPARDTRLIEKLKVLNQIEAQQKSQKEQLYTGLDSAAAKLKNLSESKNETGKIIDETRWMIKQLSNRQMAPKQKDSLLLLLPRVELYTSETRELSTPPVTPEAAVERAKKKNWFYRIFNFL